MVLDILLKRGRQRYRKRHDEFDSIIGIIERFSPPKYRSERESFYYNYRTIASYKKSLYALLETLSQKQRLKTERGVFLDELFVKLKDFYDPRDRLSMEDASKDGNLRKKFREMVQFFYGMDRLPGDGGM